MSDRNFQYKTIDSLHILKVHGSMMQLCQRTCQGKAKACTGSIFFVILNLNKRLKDFLPHINRNNRPVITYFYYKAACCLIIFYCYSYIGSCIFYCITQQITYNFNQCFAIDGCRNIFLRQINRKLYIFLSRQRCKTNIDSRYYFLNITL